MYSMKYKDADTNIKRAKGISKHVGLVMNVKHGIVEKHSKNRKPHVYR